METVPFAERRVRFEAVVAEVVEPVRRYLRRRTDEATADDVLSETLLAMWRRTEAIPPEPIPWAIGIARLQVRNAQRSAARQARLAQRVAVLDPPPLVTTAADVEGDQDDDEQVRAVLGTLRSGDAEILRLWAWDELEPRQIAPVLGVSVNAATVRLHRARARFAAAWSKTPGDAGHVGVKEGMHR